LAGLAGHFKVDKSLAMDMQASLTLNGKKLAVLRGYIGGRPALIRGYKG